LVNGSERTILSMFLVENKTENRIAKELSYSCGEVLDILGKYSLTKYHRGILNDKYKSELKSIQKELDSILDRNKKNSIVEYRALVYFLVYGFSKRGVCRLVPELIDASGNKFQAITKKYKLDKIHKGVLFLHTPKEFEGIIREIIVNKIADKSKLKLNITKYTNKYKGLSIVRNNKNIDFYNVVDGELRNLIQRVYKGIKKHIGFCQYKSCRNNRLQTSHANVKGKRRPDIFKKSVNEYMNKSKQDNKIDLEEAIYKFLERHQNRDGNTVGVKRYPPVTFLCSDHHMEYENLFDKDGNIVNRCKHDDFIDNLEF
jgi:hypothetical protein